MDTEREGFGAYIARVGHALTRHVIGDQLRAIVREPALFLGAGLLLVGLMSFEVGRYCDGNTAQYLSCTRSAAYYYYDALDRTLVVLGAILLLGWFVRR